MSDDITGIFDDLTPEDFFLETTAISEQPRSTHGIDAFNAFADEQLRATRTAFMASEGNLQPIALLANEDTQRAFTPDDEETLGEFIKRLHREARHMGAVWTFYACKTQLSATDIDPSEATGSDVTDEAEEAQARGELEPGVLWYAERREGDEQHRRTGAMYEIGPGRLGPSKESSSQTVALFTLILG